MGYARIVALIDISVVNNIVIASAVNLNAITEACCVVTLGGIGIIPLNRATNPADFAV